MVDWEPARTYTYTVAVTVSEYVGKMTARLIQALKVNPEKIHAIGFGLGKRKLSFLSLHNTTTKI